MAFRLEPEKKIRKSLRRIARKQIDAGVGAVSSSAPLVERVHDTRTAIKKLRGILRLVEPELGRRFAKEDARLRDVAKTLAELRDAEAATTTFDEIFEHFAHQLNPSLRRIRRTLATRMRRRERKLGAKSRLRRVEQQLRELRSRLGTWRPAKGGWRAIAGGFEKTYEDARLAMRTAYRTQTAEDFHDWRKTVKYHDYHVRLLAGIWPEQMGLLRKSLDQLGDFLGDDHDLSVFEEMIRGEPECFPDPADREALEGLILSRRREIRAAAQPLAARLFAEPANSLSRRVHRYLCAARRLGDLPKTAA